MSSTPRQSISASAEVATDLEIESFLLLIVRRLGCSRWWGPGDRGGSLWRRNRRTGLGLDRLAPRRGCHESRVVSVPQILRVTQRRADATNIGVRDPATFKLEPTGDDDVRCAGAKLRHVAVPGSLCLARRSSALCVFRRWE